MPMNSTAQTHNMCSVKAHSSRNIPREKSCAFATPLASHAFMTPLASQRTLLAAFRTHRAHLLALRVVLVVVAVVGRRDLARALDLPLEDLEQRVCELVVLAQRRVEVLTCRRVECSMSNGLLTKATRLSSKRECALLKKAISVDLASERSA
eukprot:6201421-Pleurochrysis_carterae.AAC.2